MNKSFRLTKAQNQKGINYEPQKHNVTAGLCNRCKVKKGTIICMNCTPYNTFCKTCDTYIHSSKLNHSRTAIDLPLTTPLSSRNLSFSDHNHIKAKSISNFPIHHNSFNDNDRIDKQDLISQNVILHKNICNLNSILNSRIKDLEYQIDDMNIKNQNDLQSLNSKHQNELESVLNDKNIQIDYLQKQIACLQQDNDSLRNEIKYYLNLINDNKIGYEDKIAAYEHEILTLSSEIRNLKSYYTDKVDYYKSIHEEEMKVIQKEYEEKIEKMKKEFEDKEKSMNDVIEDLRKKLNIYSEDQKKLTLINTELKEEIGGKEEMLEKAKKEVRDCIKEKNMIRRKHLEMEVNYTKFKNEYDRLHRITHGKFGSKSLPK